MPADPPRAKVRYELRHDQMDEVWRIERVEVIGCFDSRESARQHMIDTTAEREAADTGESPALKALVALLADWSVRAAMTPEHLELARAAGWKAQHA